MCGVGRPRCPEAPSAPRGLPLTSPSGSVLCAAPWEAAVDSEPSVSVPACGVTRSAKAPPPQVDVSSIAAAVTMSLHTSRSCLGIARASGCDICHPTGRRRWFADPAGEAGVPCLPDRSRRVPPEAGARLGRGGRPSPTEERPFFHQGTRVAGLPAEPPAPAFPRDLFFEGKLLGHGLDYFISLFLPGK